MSLAQDYFDDSAETLKQQINENRAALESLPDNVPGGHEEAFQTMFQELMDNYSAMEQCVKEARGRVAELDTDRIRRQGEVEATDAARRDARELGVDLTQIEGTGSDGRVTVDDVKSLAEQMEDGTAEAAAGQAKDQAGQAAGQATDQAGQAVGQAQDAAGQATDQAQQAAGQATDQAGQIAEQAQDVLGQVGDIGGGVTGQANGKAEEINATDAAKREAEERGIDLSKIEGTGSEGRIVIWDVTDAADAAEADPAGQLKGRAGDVAGQATQGANEAASQVAGQAGGIAGQLTEQAVGAAQQTAGQATQAVSEAEEPKITKAAKRKADEMGTDISKIQGSGAGGLITIKDVVGA